MQGKVKPKCPASYKTKEEFENTMNRDRESIYGVSFPHFAQEKFYQEKIREKKRL